MPVNETKINMIFFSFLKLAAVDYKNGKWYEVMHISADKKMKKGAFQKIVHDRMQNCENGY